MISLFYSVNLFSSWRRVAALQAKEEASGKPMKSKGGQKLSAADQDIASRLEKLKAGKKQAMGKNGCIFQKWEELFMMWQCVFNHFNEELC